MDISISRKENFNSAHRLFRPEWSVEQNKATYGKCSNPNYHGHNYDLIVTLVGPLDQKTGYVYDMKQLSLLIKNEILDKFDHKNLNLDTPYFTNSPPTTENLAIMIWQLLRQKIKTSISLKVKLYETKKNFVEYPAHR